MSPKFSDDSPGLVPTPVVVGNCGGGAAPPGGTLKLCSLVLNSTFDPVRAMNANNGVGRLGTVFNLGDQLPGEVLEQGQWPLPKNLIFRASGFHTLRGSTIDEERPALLDYDARVLALPTTADGTDGVAERPRR